MNPTLEPSDAVLRKTLDSIDRRKSITRIIAVIFFLATTLLIGGVFSTVGTHDVVSTPELSRLELISVVLGLIFWIGGMGVGIVAVSYRNTHAVLKAIALLSESRNGEER